MAGYESDREDTDPDADAARPGQPGGVLALPAVLALAASPDGCVFLWTTPFGSPGTLRSLIGLPGQGACRISCQVDDR